MCVSGVCFKEDVLSEDCKISEALLIRDCVALEKFKLKLAPNEFERLSSISLELLSKKERVTGERTDNSDSFLTCVLLELLRDLAGVGGSFKGNSESEPGYIYIKKKKNEFVDSCNQFYFIFFLFFIFYL